MRYSHAAETSAEVGERVIAIGNAVGDILAQELDKPPFDAVLVDIGYVPIVMPNELLDHYPARTKVRLGRRLLDSAPHVSFGAFLKGSDAEAVRVYVDGLRSDLSKLARLGLNKSQIASLFALLDRVERAVITRLNN